jgi:hypothetical protein
VDYGQPAPCLGVWVFGLHDRQTACLVVDLYQEAVPVADQPYLDHGQVQADVQGKADST